MHWNELSLLKWGMKQFKQTKMQTLSTTWRIIPVRSSSSVLVTRHLQAMVINHLLAGRILQVGMVYSRHRDGGAVHCRCEAFGRSQGAGFSGCGFPEGLGSRLFRKIRKRFQVKPKLNSFFWEFCVWTFGWGIEYISGISLSFLACENNPINRTHDLPLTLWQVFEHSSVGQGSM